MLKEVHKIRDHYQEPLFRMGLYHLIDKGKDHFDDETVMAAKAAIKEQEEVLASQGKIPIMTAPYQNNIIDCATELSKLSTTDILRFVKHYVYFEGDEKVTIRCRNCDSALSDDEGVEVNEGYEDLFYECALCHEFSMEGGSVILCETCGNYYTPNHAVEDGRCFDEETTCPYCSD